jgi:CheY-like chemotaxis protein
MRTVVLTPEDVPMASLHILVVDDCTATATAMAFLLRMSGHHVQVAPDGATALQKAQAGKPDVVVLDIDLPGMSGYEVSRRLRESLFDKPPLIIALAGYRQRSEEAGIDLHLVKPVEPRVLLGILSRFAKVVA